MVYHEEYENIWRTSKTRSYYRKKTQMAIELCEYNVQDQVDLETKIKSSWCNEEKRKPWEIRKRGTIAKTGTRGTISQKCDD